MKINLYFTKKKKRILLIVLAAVILVGAAGYTVFIQPYINQEQWVYKETEVTSGDLTVGVTESGTLEYGITNQLYDISLDTSSSDSDEDDEDDETSTEKYLKVEAVYIAIGQRISEGDAILKFTDDSISDVRKILASNLTEAKIAYSEAKTEYDVSLLSAKQVYDSALVAEGYASKIYKQTIQVLESETTGSALEIQQLTADIEELNDLLEVSTENLSDAKANYDLAVEYMASANMSDVSVYVDAQTIYLNAEKQYENAKSSVEMIESSITSKQNEIENLQAEIKAYQAKLSINKLSARQSYDTSVVEGSTAESIYQTSISALMDTLEQAKTAVETAEQQLSDFEEFVGDGTIYAGGSGIVTAISYAVDDSLIEEGSMFSYAKADEMTITVDVSQEDVVDISVGDQVEIVFSAYDDQVYKGIIESITTTSTSESSSTVSYPVTILVNGDTEVLYGGMTADITFITDTRLNTLYVSKKAVVTKNDKTYVYVKERGSYVLFKVTTGLSNGIYVEILDGLSEGDLVYIATKITESATDTESDLDKSSSDTTADPTETTNTTTNDYGDMNNGGMGMPTGDMPTGTMPTGGMP